MVSKLEVKWVLYTLVKLLRLTFIDKFGKLNCSLNYWVNDYNIHFLDSINMPNKPGRTVFSAIFLFRTFHVNFPLPWFISPIKSCFEVLKLEILFYSVVFYTPLWRIMCNFSIYFVVLFKMIKTDFKNLFHPRDGKVHPYLKL